MRPTDLLDAAADGKVDRVRRLLAAGADPNHATRHGDHALLCAAQNGHAEVCRVLLDAGADPDLRGPNGNTALIFAAGYGHEDVIRLLLERGASPDQRGHHGRSALFNAIHLKTTGIAKLLLEAGADLFAVDELGNTPVSEAATCESKRMQKFIRELAATRAPTAKLDIHQAAAAGVVEQVREHLASGVDVNERDRQGRTPLMHAARRGQTAAVEALLAAGADPNLTSPRGDHVMIDAVYADEPEIIRRLLATGVPVDGLHGDMTALMTAVVFGQRRAVQCLVEAGADPELANSQGQTALALAKSSRKTHQLLKQAMGAPPDAIDAVYEEVKAFKTRSATPEFQQALDLMTRRCGHDPYPWKKRKGVFRFWIRDVKRLAMALGAPKITQRGDLIPLLQEEIRRAGFLLIVGNAIEPNPPLMLFPTSNQYAVIRACGTSANRLVHENGVPGFADANYLITWLRELEETHPWQLTECGFDFLGGRFVEPVKDARALADRLVRFCPDMLSDDLRSITAELATTGRFFCWWD